MARLLRAVIGAAGNVPVTVKFRTGIDEGLLTFREAGRVAREEGARAVGLHARTAAQLYSGEAAWQTIAELKSLLPDIPVLGNGDIFEAFDALRMMRSTGCDGVIVGRGCLGRPWLFRELMEAFDGHEPSDPPNLGGVVDTALAHARLLVDFFGERIGIRNARKFMGWYLRSFPGTKRVLPGLLRASTLGELQQQLAALPRDLPFPEAALRARRAKGGSRQKVSLPPGFLTADARDLRLADPLDDHSGG